MLPPVENFTFNSNSWKIQEDFGFILLFLSPSCAALVSKVSSSESNYLIPVIQNN